MPADGRPLFIVWHGFQRRAEALAPLLGAGLVYLPNRWRSRWLRPLDYARKLLLTVQALRRERPAVVVLQVPPPFGALAALALEVPYVLDAHNAALQGFWARLPLSGWITRRAALVVAHNDEARRLAEERFPGARVAALRDPLDDRLMSRQRGPRDERRILIVCSFGPDEPIDQIHGLVAARPDLEFVITARVEKLERSWRERLKALPNLRLTGFLASEDYDALLASVGAAVVFTARSATQPSGACEALASDTPLVLSRTSLTMSLFGDWAHLVEDARQAAEALDTARLSRPDLGEYRRSWMEGFRAELAVVRARMGEVDASGRTS